MMNGCNFSFYTNFVVIARLFPRTVLWFCTDFMRIFFTARTQFNLIQRPVHSSRARGDRSRRHLNQTTEGTTLMNQSPHRQQRNATHMNQSPQEPTTAGEHAIFLQLPDGSTIPYHTLRPEIWLILQEICCRTNIAVFNQRLTLAGRELHPGDIILPNCTLVLGFQPRGGTRSHGKFQCLDVLVSVLQKPKLTTVYEGILRTYIQVSMNWYSMFISLLSSHSGVGSSKLREITPQHILKHHSCAYIYIHILHVCVAHEETMRV